VMAPTTMNQKPIQWRAGQAYAKHIINIIGYIATF
jgi:hypothetical protein